MTLRTRTANLERSMPTPAILEPVQRLTRDLRAASVTLTAAEARFLVDAYYQMQDNRIRSAHQARTLGKEGEPHAVLDWLETQSRTLEDQLRGALKRYAESQPIGEWALSITGIGPVITAGLLAHIDIRKAPTVGHIWRFAGLDPTMRWEKGTKRPWNARLKRLCWLIGESFVKVQANPRDVYGQVYAARKAQEIERNEAGRFTDQAADALTAKRWKGDTQTKAHYEAGRLPPARIHLRAERYAVKLFLAHLHHVWHWLEFNEPPPKPYVVQHLGHAHFIAPPNWTDPR
jgi:hypothetical protein